jgi:plasmid maintenance system antidote protein VapI
MNSVMIHPGWHLSNKIKELGRTQKQFADLLGKKVSEVNELINGKRNITIWWDILLAVIFDQEEGRRIKMQNDYDYSVIKMKLDKKKLDDIRRRKNQLNKQSAFTSF